MEKLNKYRQLLPHDYQNISYALTNKSNIEYYDNLLDILSIHKIVHFLIKNQALIVSQPIHRYLKRIVARNFNSTKEIFHIDSLLNKNNIKVIHLKGIVLSQLLYNDITYRSAGDIDILIQSNDLKNALEILKTEHYNNIEVKNTFWGLSIYKKFYYHFMFKKAKSNHLLEVHWALSRDNFINKKYFPEIWKNAINIEIAGNRLLTLNSEWNYIFLLVHGAIHSWFKLLWLSDLFTIVEKWTDKDWKYHEKRCRNLNIERPFYASVFLMSIFFGLKYPPDYDYQLKDKNIDDIIRFSINSIVTENYIENRFQKLIYIMKLKKGLIHKINTIKFRIIRFILRIG